MSEKKDLKKISVTELEMCPYDIEYLENAEIHTIQDILDYIEDGSRLYYIKGVHDNMERDILSCLDRQFDIKYPYKDMTTEEYMRIYQPSAWRAWCDVRDEMAKSAPTILSESLYSLKISNRTVHVYQRAGFNTVGDLVAYIYAGGNLKDGVRSAGDATAEEVMNSLKEYGLDKTYDELSGPMKAYINRRLYWIHLYRLGFSHRLIMRFHKEGFSYVGQIRDYLAKGNSIEDLVYEEGFPGDFAKLCQSIMDKLYKNGVPFSREVEEDGETDNT